MYSGLEWSVMELLGALAALGLGAVVGSFLNVVILRLGRRSFLTGRSACPECGKVLKVRHLIPIVSYVWLGGKCEDCKRPISGQYPLVEAATGLMFTASFLYQLDRYSESSVELLFVFSFWFSLLVMWALWSTLIVVFVYDLYYKIIPNSAAATFALLALAYTITRAAENFPGWSELTTDILAGPLLFLPFWALWRFSDGRWMGLGDGKLALGIGFFLGLTYGISAVILAFWIGAAVALVLIALDRLIREADYREKEGKLAGINARTEIPFGPFLVIGTVVIYFYQWDILGLAYWL